MITVIEHGMVPVYFGRCSNCGCKIQCTQEDVEYDGWITGGQFALCPDCGGRIMITEAHIPASNSISVASANLNCYGQKV